MHAGVHAAFVSDCVRFWCVRKQNRAAETRLGINGMIPGFEAGVKSMRVGGRRRVIVPPDLGPPARGTQCTHSDAADDDGKTDAFPSFVFFVGAGGPLHVLQRQAVRGV